MQQDGVVVKLAQSSRGRRPLHALPVVGHVPHVGEPLHHLPEVGFDLVAFVAAHDGVDGPHLTAPHTSQRPTPNLVVRVEGWRRDIFVYNISNQKDSYKCFLKKAPSF